MPRGMAGPSGVFISIGQMPPKARHHRRRGIVAGRKRDFPQAPSRKSGNFSLPDKPPFRRFLCCTHGISTPVGRCPLPENASNSLENVSLVKGIKKSQRAALEKRCSWRTFGEGEQIIDRHDENRDVYFLVEGQVRIVNYSLWGREIAFDDLGPGDYFGELAAIDDGPRSANVIAQTQATVAVLGPTAFAEFLHDHPAAALRVMKRLTYMVRQASERIMDLSTLGANNRIHAELLRQAMTSLKPDNSAEIRPIPHHSEIASRVSTTRETVARVLSDLARDDVVKRGRNALVIPDIHRLADMVEEVRGD